jgi:hypothetical protein
LHTRSGLVEQPPLFVAHSNTSAQPVAPEFV